VLGGVDMVTGQLRGMNGPPPPSSNGSGYHPREITLSDVVLVMKDPDGAAAIEARLKEVALREAEAAREKNANSAWAARLAKKEEGQKKVGLDLQAGWKALEQARADGKAWAEIERKEWLESQAEIVEKARRWDRIQPSYSIDLSRSDGGQSVRDLHSGQFARVGQRQEAEATRRSPAERAADLAVEATPEPEFPTGPSISRSPPKRRG
jgi:hypothetical protein